MDTETFRAAARSSPWLWRSVELTRRLVEPSPRYGDAHAWIRRPGLMRVEEAGQGPYLVDATGESGAFRSTLEVVGADREALERALPRQRPAPSDPQALPPVRRTDGLVAVRPGPDDVEYDDPMFQDYRWVAMLDPRELADGADADGGPSTDATPIEIDDVRTVERDGRATLDAVVRPTDAYDPRCACCPLLHCALTDAYEDLPVREPSHYADAYRIRLDRSTGICVAMTEIGGAHDGEGFEVTIHAVDAAYPDAMFR